MTSQPREDFAVLVRVSDVPEAGYDFPTVSESWAMPDAEPLPTRAQLILKAAESATVLHQEPAEFNFLAEVIVESYGVVLVREQEMIFRRLDPDASYRSAALAAANRAIDTLIRHGGWSIYQSALVNG